MLKCVSSMDNPEMYYYYIIEKYIYNIYNFLVWSHLKKWSSIQEKHYEVVNLRKLSKEISKSKRGGTVRISTTISVPLWQLATDLDINWSEAMRRGLSLMLSEIDLDKKEYESLSDEKYDEINKKLENYKNNLNFSRKMKEMFATMQVMADEIQTMKEERKKANVKEARL